MGLKELLLGKTATRCAECGAHVPEDEGFRVLPMQVYCNEEHAVLDQQSPAI
jgi:ribosomal protein S26